MFTAIATLAAELILLFLGITIFFRSVTVVHILLHFVGTVTMALFYVRVRTQERSGSCGRLFALTYPGGLPTESGVHGGFCAAVAALVAAPAGGCVGKGHSGRQRASCRSGFTDALAPPCPPPRYRHFCHRFRGGTMTSSTTTTATQHWSIESFIGLFTAFNALPFVLEVLALLFVLKFSFVRY